MYQVTNHILAYKPCVDLTNSEDSHRVYGARTGKKTMCRTRKKRQNIEDQIGIYTINYKLLYNN